MAAQFEEYTGMVASPSSIEQAFKLNVLTSKQSLEEILKERQLSAVHELQRSMAARASTCTKGIFAFKVFLFSRILLFSKIILY